MAKRRKAKASTKRRKHYSVAAPKKRTKKRQRGLSELNLVTGKAGRYVNPILEGGIGGFAMQLATKAVPQSLFDENPNLAKNENLIKGGIMVGLALFAAHMKQPLIAAGIAGATAVVAMQKEGILQDDSLLSNRRALKRGRFADDRLLSARSSQRSLRGGSSRSIYADYDPLYERGEYEY